METVRPPLDTRRVRCCPKKAPCPSCGKPAARKDGPNRLVRTRAYKPGVFRDVTSGE